MALDSRGNDLPREESLRDVRARANTFEIRIAIARDVTIGHL